MQTCKTCKYFDLENGGRLGGCLRWLIGYGINEDQVKDNEVLVEDDEGWCMRMGPDFGCVLHEEKQP